MDSNGDLIRFSETDLKILQTLLLEQTAMDCAASIGKTYAYTIKRIGRLKKKHLLTDRSPEINPNQHYYQTVRNEYTEHLFQMWEETTSYNAATKHVFKIYGYYGRTCTIFEAINEERKRFKETPNALDTLGLVGGILQTIKHQAFRRLQGLDNQPPDLPVMRDWLEQHLVLLKRTTRIVEEVLNNKKLWENEEAAPSLYKWIDSKELTEISGNKYADVLYKIWKENR